MKNTLTTILLAAALGGAPVTFASNSSAQRATATVEFDHPENFTDFKLSPHARDADARYLSKELQQETNRLAGNILPAGYHVILRIRDIDMAGEFEPQRVPPNDQIRFMRGVYTPRISLEYSVTDAAGNVVSSGERRLTDLGYDQRIHTPGENDHLHVELNMIGDFLREIARATS